MLIIHKDMKKSNVFSSTYVLYINIFLPEFLSYLINVLTKFKQKVIILNMKQETDIIKGDKVVVLRGDYKGLRGIIDEIQEDTVKVIFPEDTVLLPIKTLQNFSAAARKAWQTRPYRAAGRPKDLEHAPKRMVSLRLDATLWDELGKAVEMGKIRSREAAVNQWLREKLDILWVQENEVVTAEDNGGMLDEQ